MNNLTISYDLYKQGQDYHAIIGEIKTLGNWARLHKSVWHVKSGLSAAQAVERLKRVIDSNDSLYIVDSTNNESAWCNLDSKVSEFLQQNWHAKSGLRNAMR